MGSRTMSPGLTSANLMSELQMVALRVVGPKWVMLRL